MSNTLSLDAGRELRVDGEITRNNILNHAEELFSIRGYTGVSVREITNSVDVHVALINYHFGSKEKLFHEVLIRRVAKMSERRIERLNAVTISQNNRKAIESILWAFIDPLIGESPEEVNDLRNYRRLIALVANSKTWQEVVFKEHYDSTAVKFIRAIQIALPNNDGSDIFWGFNFFLGSLTNTIAETGRVDRISDGTCKSCDLKNASIQLVNYTTNALMGKNKGKY